MKILQQLLMRKKAIELKESTRMMNSHRSDNEKNYLIEEGKKISIHGIIKQIEIINKNLKSQI